MKKFVASSLIVLATAASAADFVSVEYDNVSGRAGATDSKATTVRAGKEIGGLQFGVQSRTAKFDNGNLTSSLEGTVGKNFGGFTPFVGAGHDFGINSGRTQNYGLVGAQYGLKAGPGFALAGIKTRVSTNSTDTKQTVTYAGYSVPVAKNVSVGINASRSSQDIKEKSVGVGVTVAF